MDGAMDERYIQEVARLIAGTDSPRSCARCGGLAVVTAAVPVDVDTLGVPCLPITYCRRCDAADPQAAELFAYLDEALGNEDTG